MWPTLYHRTAFDTAPALLCSKPLMRDLGVVVPAPLDWGLGDTSLTFSLVVGGFAWGALFGTYHDRWGMHPSSSFTTVAVYTAPPAGRARASTGRDRSTDFDCLTVYLHHRHHCQGRGRAACLELG